VFVRDTRTQTSREVPRRLAGYEHFDTAVERGKYFLCVLVGLATDVALAGVLQ
jgi:hypothetical protein